MGKVKLAIAVLVAAPLGLLLVFGVERTPIDIPRLVHITANTCAYAAAVAVLTGGFGGLFGWLLARTKQRALKAILMLPVALPAVLLCMGAYDLFGQSSTSFVGVVSITTVAYLPWVLGPVGIAIERVDPALEEAARMSGAKPLRAFFDASWPLVRNEWMTSVLMVFSLTAATFGIPYFLGGLSPARFATLTTDMVERLHVSGEHAFAQALISGAVLVALSLGTTVIARKPKGGDSGRPARHVIAKAPLLTALAWAFACIGIVAPLAALVARARGYGQLMTGEALGIFARSAVLATVGAAAIVAIGAGWGQSNKAAEQTIRLVYALPGTLVGLAWVLVAALNFRIVVLDRLTLVLALQGSVWLLGLAYVSKYLSVGIDSAQAAFARVSPTLIEAARMSDGQPFRDITLPLSKPALLSTFALLWMTLFPELTLSVLLFGPSTQTVGTWLFELASYTDPARASALAVVVAALCMAMRVVLRD